MTKEVKITVPEGYEIDKENSTFECIKFKPIKNELPRTWEEFCNTYNMTRNEYYIGDGSELKNTLAKSRNPIFDANMLPNIETAKAMLALCQLIQLRDCYNDGWVPDWTNAMQRKFCIHTDSNRIHECTVTWTNTILAFKTEELCNKFFENFRDLIETAKSLL